MNRKTYSGLEVAKRDSKKAELQTIVDNATGTNTPEQIEDAERLLALMALWDATPTSIIPARSSSELPERNSKTPLNVVVKISKAVLTAAKFGFIQQPTFQPLQAGQIGGFVPTTVPTSTSTNSTNNWDEAVQVEEGFEVKNLPALPSNQFWAQYVLNSEGKAVPQQLVKRADGLLLMENFEYKQTRNGESKDIRLEAGTLVNGIVLGLASHKNLLAIAPSSGDFYVVATKAEGESTVWRLANNEELVRAGIVKA